MSIFRLQNILDKEQTTLDMFSGYRKTVNNISRNREAYIDFRKQLKENSDLKKRRILIRRLVS